MRKMNSIGSLVPMLFCVMIFRSIGYSPLNRGEDIFGGMIMKRNRFYCRVSIAAKRELPLFIVF